MSERRCLIIVDVQNDFCPGGSLPVQEGNMVVGPINDLIAHATEQGWLIVASQDWHPEHTVHFTQDRTDGKGWPAHCVQNTRGAEFHPDLKINDQVVVVRKGLNPENDGGYSAFEGRNTAGQSLLEILHVEDSIDEIDTVIVVGLATDYCVKATVLDAITHLFDVSVVVVTDAVRAVNVEPGDGDNAIASMRIAGAHLLMSQEIITEFR